MPFRSFPRRLPDCQSNASQRNGSNGRHATQQQNGQASRPWVSSQHRLTDLTVSTPLTIARDHLLFSSPFKELVLLVARYFILAFSARSLLVFSALETNSPFPDDPFHDDSDDDTTILHSLELQHIPFLTSIPLFLEKHTSRRHRPDTRY